MIGSAALDLPEHRKQAVEACLREGVFPIGMEQLPARDATGIQVSLEMVDKADIYIGFYGWRYGWVPDFDESKFEPLPDVELNPKDEFWVDPASLDSLAGGEGS
jgi:hypothetical protein